MKAIRGHVIYLDEKDGGRISAPQSGFAPQIKLGSVFTTCRISALDERKVFSFNEEHAVEMFFPFFDQYSKEISNLKNFDIYEGSKKIGFGVVEVR